MTYSRISRWSIIILILASFLIAKSLVPRYELRVDAPTSFVAAVPLDYPNREALAQQYWQRACTLRWSYIYGQNLPDTPPDDFLRTGTSGLSADQESRLQIILWRRIQVLWFDPAAWAKSYHLDFGWVADIVRAVTARPLDFGHRR